MATFNVLGEILFQLMTVPVVRTTCIGLCRSSWRSYAKSLKKQFVNHTCTSNESFIYVPMNISLFCSIITY